VGTGRSRLRRKTRASPFPTRRRRRIKRINDTPGGQDNEISPDILGYIFEKYINQKSFGAYYTRPEITEYLSERTIHRLILDAINTPEIEKQHPMKGVQQRDYHNIAELLINLDAGMCRELLFTVLPNMSLLDPACGSGAFLVAAMKTLINVYAAVIGKIKFLSEFKTLGIKYEQATWDRKNGEEGKSQKRQLTAGDIRRLQPFHWGYEFDKVLNERGGFDAIITNPPWEVFQTNEKEFFQHYASTIKKKSLRIEDWEAQRIKLMKDDELCGDWLD
jgi:type I restriction-modification system DNA methylase subunit